jgi:hypothetical protein
MIIFVFVSHRPYQYISMKLFDVSDVYKFALKIKAIHGHIQTDKCV